MRADGGVGLLRAGDDLDLGVSAERRHAVAGGLKAGVELVQAAFGMLANTGHQRLFSFGDQRAEAFGKLFGRFGSRGQGFHVRNGLGDGLAKGGPSAADSRKGAKGADPFTAEEFMFQCAYFANFSTRSGRVTTCRETGLGYVHSHAPIAFLS